MVVFGVEARPGNLTEMEARTVAIRCIALDMDRTTLDETGGLSPGNRAALERALRRGVHIVIASGRTFTSLPADVVEIPGITSAITSNGAAVYHVPTGRSIHRYLLTPGSVEQVLALTAEEDVAYEAFVDGQAYADAAYVGEPERYGATRQAVEYVQRTRRPEVDMAAFLRAHIEELDGMDIVVRSQETKTRLWRRLEREVPDLYVTSSVERLLELAHRDAGKHSGLRFVLECLGIRREETAAFGDGDNDAEMLAFAGTGIAMANATSACLRAADYVTRSNSEDGVAWGMAHFLTL